jgi:putative peptidoglycan lipid II flippase
VIGTVTSTRPPRIAHAAALIAVLTIVARLAGFARVFVFSETVGYTDLGSAYQTANSIPNIIFEVVAGGALAALVVPLLAGPPVGTTLGVVVLSLCLVPPVLRLGLPWRATLRFEPGLRGQLGGLAWVGVLTVAIQQLAYALTIALVNWRTAAGALVLFSQAQTVYLLPWAVLAVPVATSAYPVLASTAAAGDLPLFQHTLARATRGVLLLSGLGASGLVALAWPAAWVYGHVAGEPGQVPGLARAIVAFAPGLLGYGLFALLSRALYAQRQNRAAARATVLGWGAVALVSVLVALVAPVRERVAALAAANSAGMLVLGVVLVVLVGRYCGTGALAGVGRATGVTLLAGTLATLAGVGVRAALPNAWGWYPVLGAAVLSAAVVVLVYATVAALVDRKDVRILLSGPRGEGS